RHAMRITPEVAQHRRGAPKGGLRVDDPVLLEEGIDEGVPVRRVAQVFGPAGEVEFVPVVRTAERFDKLAPKDATEDLHGEEEARVLRVAPSRVIGRQPAGGDDAVHVRMAYERLAPRVEDAEDADLRAKMPRVGGHLAERRGACLEEPRVQTDT